MPLPAKDGLKFQLSAACREFDIRCLRSLANHLLPSESASQPHILQIRSPTSFARYSDIASTKFGLPSCDQQIDWRAYTALQLRSCTPLRERCCAKQTSQGPAHVVGLHVADCGTTYNWSRLLTACSCQHYGTGRTERRALARSTTTVSISSALATNRGMTAACKYPRSHTYSARLALFLSLTIDALLDICSTHS